MLTAKNLSKVVEVAGDSLVILDDISFELDSAKSLAIVGESGSGKTTLLGLLGGLDEPSSGEVLFQQHSIFAQQEEDRARFRKENLGFVFQNFQLIEGLTALENVMMPLELRADKSAKSKAVEILNKVGLGQRLGHYANQLSGGEQQRVAIARAFVTEPKLLLADEPTGNLDTATGENIIELMFSLVKDFHTTLVLVTHDNHLAKLCDQVITISAGKLVSPSVNH
ncbi:MAG: ABC transporter ATP-binding protein [Gammaproteobacteria bacterium]|nr:ABC transporter ATP-binding protein [Gammaproteobacteria bacterium]MDH5630629.1 ABC transporter ATP-binding protein [Gammaproteobacteria bacterium]